MKSCLTSPRSIVHIMKLVIQLSTKSGKRGMHLHAKFITVSHLEKAIYNIFGKKAGHSSHCMALTGNFSLCCFRND